ncbi:MAG: ABC transporter ATP-binding protein/permease [Clostridia bacterium]|nr:ABC transporter ATP-binding protein/permease [Clostridia bacterium]
MIKRELLEAYPEAIRHIVINVIAQLLRLGGNIVMVFSIALLIRKVFAGETIAASELLLRFGIIFACACVRYLGGVIASRESFLASAGAKKKLRSELYEKLTRLGPGYHEKVSTGEVIQVAVEGIDQLETYFGRYLPQFFYAILAPIILFIVLSQVSLKAAAALFVCVPLIPIAIMLVQTLAKNLLRRYWGRYTQLGDTFLENMQGLTTLKIYGADAKKHEEMNEKAEEFRFITMKVLTMQLNSIIIMDIVAYGGAALGVILAVIEAMQGHIEVYQAFAIIMLSADFFLPMRTLGSYFHIAMNGMAASDKLFGMLRLEEDADGERSVQRPLTVMAQGLTFSYDGERDALKDVSLTIPEGSLTAVVGESGCGKSTLAALIYGQEKGYLGSLKIGKDEVYHLSSKSLRETITVVSSGSYIFAGTVRENLQMGKPDATEEEMIRALQTARIWEWLKTEGGLDREITPEGSSLSGGQRQRIALARALLHDTPFYIFDEATSNIDVESEQDIMEAIESFRGKKTVLLITHRLENAVPADCIHVLDAGCLVGSGTHEALMQESAKYRELYTAQATYEQYARKGAEA